jgi:hypothetical protein
VGLKRFGKLIRGYQLLPRYNLWADYYGMELEHILNLVGKRRKAFPIL